MTTPTPETAGQTSTDASTGADTRSFSQEQVNSLLAEAKRKAREGFADYGDLKAKAEQFDALQEKNKSDLQKAEERATEAEQRAAQAELKALRADVAIAKGVPAKLLSGTTKEELEASADELLEFRGQPAAPEKKTVTVLTPGGETSKRSGREAGLAEAQKRFGTKTQ